VEALLLEGFRVLEGLSDGLRDGRGEFDPSVSFVEFDAQAP